MRAQRQDRRHLEPGDADTEDAVVFGHTYKAFCETIGGVLYLNPGYAGKPKFGAERTVAILRCQEMRVEFLSL